MKRSLLCLFLALCLGLCACTGNSSNPAADAIPNSVEPDSAATHPGANYADAELARAVTLGFGEYKEGDPAVTYAEFFKMLDRTVGLADPDKLVEWQSMLPDARKSNRAILRCEAMLALYFAAEALGQEYVGYNDGGQYIWSIINSLYPDDKTYGMSINMDAGDYDLFPNADQNAKYQDNFYIAAAYYMGIGRLSFMTNEPLVELDTTIDSFRPGDALTHTEALLAVLRLYESVLPSESPRVLTELDREILAKADARREAIRNSPTEVTVTGKKYYVSNDGNDTNDGLSPETAWATLDKLNKFKFKPGDGVFLKRGDIWRFQMLQCQEGVTYSAYGEGEKPRIYGSPENGADPEKWSLVPGTDNVWVFYKDMQDCGTLVFNEGESYAQKASLWWDGSKYVKFVARTEDFDLNIPDKTSFAPSNLLDMEFYNDIDYSGFNIITSRGSEKEPHEQLDVKFWNSHTGKLYFRCDTGNPGQIYSSIEFCMNPSETCESTICADVSDVVVDNICVKYTSLTIMAGAPTSMIYSKKNLEAGMNVTIQNCEFGWGAGVTEGFSPYGYTVYAGDGPHVDSRGIKVLNNYIYEGFDSGITIELAPLYMSFGDDWKEMDVTWGDYVVKGNLVENCNNSLVFSNDETPYNPKHIVKNMLIEDNYFLYSGYGHSYDGVENTHAFKKPDRLEFWHTGWGFGLMCAGGQSLENYNDGTVFIKDNIFYIARQALVDCAMSREWFPNFSGNVFVQNNYGRFAHLLQTDGKWTMVNMARPDIHGYVKEQLGDNTAIIAPVSTGVPTS